MIVNRRTAAVTALSYSVAQVLNIEQLSLTTRARTEIYLSDCLLLYVKHATQFTVPWSFVPHSVGFLSLYLVDDNICCRVVVVEEVVEALLHTRTQRPCSTACQWAVEHWHRAAGGWSQTTPKEKASLACFRCFKYRRQFWWHASEFGRASLQTMPSSVLFSGKEALLRDYASIKGI